MTESTAHRIGAEQLRAPLRAFGLPVDQMDDDAISSAPLPLYGVGSSFAGTFAHLLSEDERVEALPGKRLRVLADFCEAIEGLADANEPEGGFVVEVFAPYHAGLVEEEIPVSNAEEAAQVFRNKADPPEKWTLAEIVEEIQNSGQIQRKHLTSGRTVAVRRVQTGVGV